MCRRITRRWCTACGPTLPIRPCMCRRRPAMRSQAGSPRSRVRRGHRDHERVVERRQLEQPQRQHQREPIQQHQREPAPRREQQHHAMESRRRSTGTHRRISAAACSATLTAGATSPRHAHKRSRRCRTALVKISAAAQGERLQGIQHGGTNAGNIRASAQNVNRDNALRGAGSGPAARQDIERGQASRRAQAGSHNGLGAGGGGQERGGLGAGGGGQERGGLGAGGGGQERGGFGAGGGGHERGGFGAGGGGQRHLGRQR